MAPRLPFITGVVMLVLAGTLAFVVTHGGDEAGRIASPGVDRSKRPKGGPGSGSTTDLWQPEFHAGATRSGSPDRSGRASRPDSPLARGQAQVRTDLKVGVKPGHPQQAELEAAASKVEAFANHRLEQLTQALDLTAEQQTRIFPILVRGAQSYDPGMQVVDGRGSNGTSTPLSENTAATEPLDPQREQELLQEELTPRQADALLDLSIRDLMIWEELINDLTRQLDQATPGQVADATPPPASNPAPAATPESAVPITPAAEPPATGSESTPLPESHGGRNLFDLLPGG